MNRWWQMDTDAQTILLLAFREHQPQRVICQIARCSERALSYKIPAALAQLAALLDRANNRTGESTTIRAAYAPDA